MQLFGIVAIIKATFRLKSLAVPDAFGCDMGAGDVQIDSLKMFRPIV